MTQLFQVERERGGWNLHGLRNRASGNARGTGLDQKTEHRKPCFLCQRGERRYRRFSFHIFIIMET